MESGVGKSISGWGKHPIPINLFYQKDGLEGAKIDWEIDWRGVKFRQSISQSPPSLSILLAAMGR
jgi:hypothetical protein